MIVHDLDILGSTFDPSEADPQLPIDPNSVLAPPVST